MWRLGLYCRNTVDIGNPSDFQRAYHRPMHSEQLAGIRGGASVARCGVSHPRGESTGRAKGRQVRDAQRKTGFRSHRAAEIRDDPRDFGYNGIKFSKNFLTSSKNGLYSCLISWSKQPTNICSPTYLIL